MYLRSSPRSPGYYFVRGGIKSMPHCHHALEDKFPAVHGWGPTFPANDQVSSVDWIALALLPGSFPQQTTQSPSQMACSVNFAMCRQADKRSGQSLGIHEYGAQA